MSDRNAGQDANRARDAAGIGPHARPGIKLVPLRELDDYNVADGDADVRGWEVRTVGGRELGKVADMLVDTDASEVVMLDVDLANSDRHTLAPVRAAQIDRARRVVVIDSADLQDTEAVPSLRRDAAPTEDESRQFHDRYQRAYGERGWGRERDWQVPHGDHDLEFRRRVREEDRTAEAGLGAGATADADVAAPDAARRDAQLAEATRADADRRSRELRWAKGEDEVVVERRPMIEEVVDRRRIEDPANMPGTRGDAGSSPRDGTR